MKLTILNDVHIGADRKNGTTSDSRSTLRKSVLSMFSDLLPDNDVLIAGDLFDGVNISNADLLETYHIIRRHLSQSSGTVYLMPGNHDLPKNSTQLSDFQLLAALLKSNPRVVYITEPTMIQDCCYVIPHMANQELFNAALASVPICRYVVLHCNYDNNFAVESDHSLNLSKEAAEALPTDFIMIAHEHQQKTALDGKVVIIGNQIPSSIADCLGNQTKRRVTLDGTGYTSEDCWQAAGSFLEVPWDQLDSIGQEEFIRVIGTADGEHALAAQEAINRLRQTSSAFIIANAVQSGKSAMSVEEALEKVRGFNISEALKNLLPSKLHTLYDAALKTSNTVEQDNV